MRSSVYCLSVIVLVSITQYSCDAGTVANLALQKPYTWSTPPFYQYGGDRMCTDDGDKAQLTDGELSDRLWWDKRMVAWGSSFYLTIDLGDVFPIGSINIRAASCPSGQMFPESIDVFVSKTLQSYGYVSRWNKPLESLQASQRVYRVLDLGQVDRLGRYITLYVKGALFADEIYVYEAAKTAAIADADNLTEYAVPVIAPSLDECVKDLGLIHDGVLGLALTMIRDEVLSDVEVELPEAVEVVFPKLVD